MLYNYYYSKLPFQFQIQKTEFYLDKMNAKRKGKNIRKLKHYADSMSYLLRPVIRIKEDPLFRSFLVWEVFLIRIQ